jgi:membrane-bound inhibitor of C-type lysozyme
MLRQALLAAGLIAPLAVAACGERPAEPKQEAATPAATEPAPPPPDAPPQVIEAGYECVPAMALSVKYDNSVDPPKAVLTLDGKTYEMTRAISASGARYMALDARSPGMALVWWNKGQEGFLQEGKGEAMADEKIIATCVEKSS